MDWLDKWNKDEKDDTRRFHSDGTSYSDSYPYLPKKFTIIIVVAATLMFIGIINGVINPGPPTLPTDAQIDVMSCAQLQEFIIANTGSYEVGMDYYLDKATMKFLNVCSSYG